MLKQHKGQGNNTRSYFFFLLVGWSILVILSLGWNIHESRITNLEKARIEARTFYELNLAYRRWGAIHGGVYVPVTGAMQPNPYLQVSERDVTTTAGKRLTLVNPAWMTRQVFEMLRDEGGQPVISHLTSRKYVNPVNKPDTWEEQGLLAFEKGETEISEATVIEDRPYMRILKPFGTEPSCLPCHEHQGYQVGDIRGGISIAVPLQPHLTAAAREQRTLMASHLVLWSIGAAGILLFFRRVERHERQVRDREKEYRILFDSNPHAMWVYDLETLRFLAVNDAAVRNYGYSREEFLAMTIADIRPKEDIVPLLENISRVTTGLDKAGIWRHRKKDGAVMVVEVTSHVVDFGGRRAEIVLADDMTERHRLEDQLRQAQKMEAVGLLAGGISHDFNNILTAIIGYSNLLYMKLPPQDPLRSYAENIISTTQRAAQLTQSLLAFSRKQVIDRVPVELNSIIGRIAKLLRRLIPEDIDIQLDLTEKNTTVLADSVQFEQVLMNLATNARDAMPQGGSLAVRTAIVDWGDGTVPARRPGRPGRYVRLSVSDTGTGMDDLTKERIFEPFFTTKEMGKGTGLGLAMVYGIVSQHDGLIDVESAPGAGTTFIIHIPLAGSGRGPEPPEPPMTIPGGSETILVAEDDDALRNLVRAVLEEFGYTVIVAADGEEAVRLFREHRDAISLLLFDVIMPRKNGRAACGEIRAVAPDVKALFVTGYSADIISKEGILEAGMDMIAKPISPIELIRKVREVLDRRT